MQKQQLQFDTVIVGSGVAGLATALRLANHKQNIALITKLNLAECNSYYAQGGIAAVINNNDSITSHINDTLIAGAGLCNELTVTHIIENAASSIDWLIEMGVNFTLDDSNPTGFHLTKEGGHSFRRILHVADATGSAIINSLINKIKAHPNITIFENHVAIDLITKNKKTQQNSCYGLYILNRFTNKIFNIAAKNTVLASGGVGKVYLYTTNPDVATGDGIAMAYRSGAKIANMEFIQFHPTCLYHQKAKSFLISEAVRGEGGILKLPTTGYRFMQDHDSRLELAPRDITARSIDYQMKKHGSDYVNLDISYKPESFIKDHFPNIYSKCLSLGIDITKEAIPVVPAAHYTCGGILTDLNGQTNIEHLYAIGECAHTGLHGANRLASNSLLECLVISKNACDNILLNQTNFMPVPTWDESKVVDNDEEIIISHNWDELRRTMWDYVGIVRTNKRLERASHRITMLKNEIHEYYCNFKLSANLIELRNLVVNAELIVKSAQLRQESRGLHFSSDYPNTLPQAKDTILTNSSD
jgi:L-aspartate oxidase